ncbi:hypothetical protein SLITO_v1c06580 [Spiroplasma litorale]|uniref:Lipoprotein n=1 Tax=Spiroplasma litorale TaxID=216942 RepID=A0A0K1W2I2_9MOLU|nr:hypothetical protein [Spiroplasma litorale]AKX34287.1 hypothetical protein SLITO_v1c06580 [Spiroplasma litorale]
MKKLILCLNAILCIGIVPSNVLSCENNNNQSTETTTPNIEDQKRDLSSIREKDLKEIKSNSDLQTLKDIISKIIEMNKDDSFSINDVKFSDNPTLNQAKIEALPNSSKVKGSVVL